MVSTDSNHTDAVIARPSLRGRMATRMVRVVVKRWAKGDPPAVVRRARRVFGLPNFLNFLYSRGLKIEKVDTDTVRGEWIRPRALAASHPSLAASDQSLAASENVVLYLHGGGYVSCSPATHRSITTALARLVPCRVFSLDYRLAPEHPFPAAVDDAVAAFRWLANNVAPPEKIALAGDSAGGGLVIATMLRLRKLGQTLPGCGVCLSPWVDLTGADRYQNSGSCSMFQPADVATFAKLYLNGVSAETDEASPLFADLTGLPPLLTQVSSTELLLDDAVRLQAKATECGIASTLHVYPELPHVWQILAGVIPEAGQALREIVSFISAAFIRASISTSASTREGPAAAGSEIRISQREPAPALPESPK